jgi:salicylate hydroxylase
MIVIGCGLAGLTASIALAKAGHKITIIESAPSIEYVGAGNLSFREHNLPR